MDEKEKIINEEIVEENIENNDSNGLINFKLSNFEGPLDLLLSLIKASKMEIEDVKLADITSQYLEYINQMQVLDMDLASEFIEVAATLIEIKSKSLLPKINDELDEVEDVEGDLKRRLKEYSLLKEASLKMAEIENVNRLYKAPDEMAKNVKIVLKDMNLENLINAFTNILLRNETKNKVEEPKKIVRDVYTVQQKIASIKDALLIKDEIVFTSLLEENPTKGEIINTFLALLELLKFQEVTALQDGTYSDIIIKKKKEENENEQLAK